MDIFSQNETRSNLRSVLNERGIREALVYLNGLTTFRFTALYRFDNDMLRKTFFYDRLNPTSDGVGPDIPIEASYCIYLRNANAPFSTANSLEDDRVANHAKRREILSYCGVPLTHPSGDMFGSVCHFDFEPKPSEDSMVELMENFAQMLSENSYLEPLAE